MYIIFLNLCTFKTPSLSAFMSDKGNCYHALFKCEGVKCVATMRYLNSTILIRTVLSFLSRFCVSIIAIPFKTSFDLYMDCI